MKTYRVVYLNFTDYRILVDELLKQGYNLEDPEKSGLWYEIYSKEG